MCVTSERPGFVGVFSSCSSSLHGSGLVPQKGAAASFPHKSSWRLKLSHHGFRMLSWQYSPKQRDWIHPHSAKILGALDLGGASAQISFIPSDSITDTTKAYKFSLYGFGYTIYTHSYLCYGQNEALKQVVQKLIKVRGILLWWTQLWF